MTTFDLGTVPIFSGLPAEDLVRLSAGISEVRLDKGDTLFDEGDDADRAYVIAEGELEILKESGGRNVRIAVSSVGDVVGEMALLTSEPRNAGARALTPILLIAIPRSCLENVLATSVQANRAMFSVFITRWREQESRVRQSERMAQIGVLTAGLAHEMNNPAAAVTSGSEGLAERLEGIIDLATQLPPGTELPSPSRPSTPMSAIERADAEDSLARALTALDVPDPWQAAADMATAGFVANDLTALSGEHARAAVEFSGAAAGLRSMLAEVNEGSRRLSELVAALKSYSFLDQAPVQQVDIAKGIEDTLLILRSKTKDITTVTDLAVDLPSIVAYGSQLNQVWTNLIDNAADAVHAAGIPDGQIVIRAGADGDHVVVEVENNGPPIPANVIDRIFEAFYTTKEPGKGTGLGLDTAYSVVVNRHRGSLTVTSVPNSTVFTVTLPTSQDEG